MAILDVAFGCGIDAVRLIDWWFGACGTGLSNLAGEDDAASEAKDAANERERKWRAT